jgi:hypothetical protein
MHNFLKAKLNIKTSEMSKDNIKKRTFVDFKLWKVARYAPSSSATIQKRL